MPVELVIIGLAIIVAGLGSFIAARASLGSGGLWPAAWAVVLLGVSAEQIYGSGVSMWIGHLFGTVFAGLILAGAIRFVGRPLPRWLLPTAVALGLGRALLAAGGHDALAGVIALVPEPAAELYAALLVYRHCRTGSPPLQQRLLAPALVLLAGVDLFTGVVSATGGDRSPLLMMWLLSAALLSLLQLTTFLAQLQERIRDRTAELARRNAELSAEIDVRVNAEEALRLSEDRYRRLSSMNSDFSFIVRLGADADHELEWAAGAYERITGYTIAESTRAGWDSLVHPDDLPSVRHYFGSQPAGKTASLEYRILCKDGSICWVEQFGVLEIDPATGVRRLYGASHDITWKKEAEAAKSRLEARMRDAQKLESLGVLAGGVAHDFNNLLTVILGNTAMVLSDLPDGSAHKERLERVRKTAQYAADLTGQMLAYAGSTVMAAKPLDLSRLAEDMLSLLSPELAGRIQLECDFPPALPMVEGDESRLRQVVLNLVTNAAEAMGEQGGRLRITTGTQRVDPEQLGDALPSPEFPAEQAVYLEVRDDGPGIDDATRSRIFEPFFTTKTFAPGKTVSGRGLGLAAVLGIVRGHRGVILLESAPGQGTCFRVLLPASPQTSSGARKARAAKTARTGATLLLIDDDEMVREIAWEFLKRAGFRVELAASGEAGLARLAELGSEIDLVLLDFVMPDMDGNAVLRGIRALEPDLPVVVVTGYPQELKGSRENLALSGYLEKPYDPETLIAMVNAALDG